MHEANHPRPQDALTGQESRAIWKLCAVYASSLLGLYMVLPVLSPYAHTLRGQTDLLVGVSIGAYGLTQTLFQIPFGHLSDRIGRRKTIVLGLIIFSLGGVLAAASDRMDLLLLGRLLQGAGAVTAAVSSLVADLARPAVRTQAMARLQASVAGAIALGVILGPVAAHLQGVRAIFWGTAAVSLLGAFLLLLQAPAPRTRYPEEPVHAADLLGVLGQRPLFLLDAGTFVLHALVTVLFVVVPFSLGSRIGIHRIWKYAVPITALAIPAMLLGSRISDRPNRSETVLFAGGGILGGACLVLALAGGHLAGVVLGVAVFLVAVALLEPALPALASRLAAGDHRGAAMGAFHMSQFLGTFSGGVLGGVFLQRDRSPLFAGAAVLIAAWMLGLRSARPWIPASSAPETDRLAARMPSAAADLYTPVREETHPG